MPRKRPPATLEVGVPGLRHYAGRIDEEWHRNLKGSKAAAVYEEMRDNDATIGAVFYTIEAFLRAVDWKVEGPDEAEKEFLRSCMHDMETPWEDFISDVLSFLTYGHSLHEVVYKVRRGPEEPNPRYQSASDDGRFGWRDIALRAQRTIDRWEIDDQGRILGAYQRPPVGSLPDRFLPMDRCVLFRTRAYKNNPEGRSILRNSYVSYTRKKRLEEIEALGIARDNTGVPIIHAPAQILSATASPAQQATRARLEMLISSMQRGENEGFVFPSEVDSEGKPTGYKFNLTASPGQKQIPADPVIRRYDARILMSMAAEFLMLGTEKQGSFALGSEKSSNFTRSLSWYIDSICATLNKTAVKRLYDVNGVPVEKRARIVAGEIDMPGLQELGLFMQQAVSSGLIHPTPEIEMKLREVARMPGADLAEIEELFAEAERKEEEAAQAQADALAASQAESDPEDEGAPPPKAKPGKPPAKKEPPK
jgi:hypothetical protein